MRGALLRLGLMAGILALPIGESPALSTSTIRINPAIVGWAPFDANLIDFSYQASIDQIAPAGICSVANPCTFHEFGSLSFSTFRSGFNNAPIPASTSGLNLGPGGYTITGDIIASGTAVPFTDAHGNQGLRTTFNRFDVILAVFGSNGVSLRMASATPLLAGGGHLFMPLTSQAEGDFNVFSRFGSATHVFGLPPFFGDAPLTATFAGNHTNVTGVTFGTFSGGTIQGSGNLSFTTSPSLVPEPSSILLLGSGLAGLGWFFRRSQR